MVLCSKALQKDLSGVCVSLRQLKYLSKFSSKSQSSNFAIIESRKLQFLTVYSSLLYTYLGSLSDCKVFACHAQAQLLVKYGKRLVRNECAPARLLSCPESCLSSAKAKVCWSCNSLCYGSVNGCRRRRKLSASLRLPLFRITVARSRPRYGTSSMARPSQHLLLLSAVSKLLAGWSRRLSTILAPAEIR